MYTPLKFLQAIDLTLSLDLEIDSMPPAPFAPIQQPRSRLARRMAIVLIPLALLPLLIIGALTYFFGRDFLSNVTVAQDGRMPLILIIFIGLLIVIAIAVYLMTYNLTRPVMDLANTVNLFANGHWDQRSSINRDDEVGFLADSFNSLAEDLSLVHGQLGAQMRERTGELNTLAEISAIMVSAGDLDDLLEKTVQLVNAQYQFIYTGVFLSDISGYEDGQFATLQSAGGDPEVMERMNIHKVPISEGRGAVLAGCAIATNTSQVRALKDPNRSAGSGTVAPAYYEAAIPIASGEIVMGAFDIFTSVQDASSGGGPLSPQVLSELQTIAAQIATSVRNFQLIEASQINIDEANALFRAGQQITKAEDTETILGLIQETLDKCDYRSAILLATGDQLRLVYCWRDIHKHRSEGAQIPTEFSRDGLSQLFSNSKPVFVNELRTSKLPQELLVIPRILGCYNAAYLPAIQGDQLAALLILGSAPRIRDVTTVGDRQRNSGAFSAVKLQPFANLIQLLAITIGKLDAQGATKRRLSEVETLWEIGKVITVETDLNTLFQTIHHQIEQAIGELDTIGIGLFDGNNQTIEFPYLYEEGQVLKIQPIALGKGLTSLVLTSKKPLLLVEGTEQKSRELGALTVGKPAKSWLGVPLLFGGEAIGIIIVQDNENEHQFSIEDQRLLSTMAAQVAVAVRNARLLDNTRLHVDHERLVNEISARIRRSVDIQNVMKTTTEELGRALSLAKRPHRNPHWFG